MSSRPRRRPLGREALNRARDHGRLVAQVDGLLSAVNGIMERLDHMVPSKTFWGVLSLVWALQLSTIGLLLAR